MADAVAGQEAPVFTAGVLAAAVAVEHEASGRAGVQGLAEGIGDEPGTEVTGEGPADSPAGVANNHHGQIEPAFSGGNK